jgi:hypothetical protein
MMCPGIFSPCVRISTKQGTQNNFKLIHVLLIGEVVKDRIETGIYLKMPRHAIRCE